jgi:hypothetical protein
LPAAQSHPLRRVLAGTSEEILARVNAALGTITTVLVIPARPQLADLGKPRRKDPK